jgi:hypothetical protein
MNDTSRAMRNLRSVAIQAYAKIHKNRYKDVPGKWHPNSYTLTSTGLPERMWSTAPIDWLCRKLGEEFSELVFAVASTLGTDEDVRQEAGDVVALAMMIADNHRALQYVPKVVCLCGSTKFKQEFIDANFHETMAGNIVLSVGFFAHTDTHVYTLTPGEKTTLDELHKRKIDLADEILVLNVGGYIGSSTKSEIDYAENTGKKVRWLEPLSGPVFTAIQPS